MAPTPSASVPGIWAGHLLYQRHLTSHSHCNLLRSHSLEFIPSSLSLRCLWGRSQALAMWAAPPVPTHDPKLETAFAGVAIFFPTLQCTCFCEAEIVRIVDVEREFCEGSDTLRDISCKIWLWNTFLQVQWYLLKNVSCCLLWRSGALMKLSILQALIYCQMLLFVCFFVCFPLPCRWVMFVS